MSISTVLINGEPSNGTVPVTDSSVLRGDGCFEVIRAYRGVPFRLDEHLDRLERSASALDIELPSEADLTEWVERCANAVGDGAVRVVVTRGSGVPGLAGESLVIVFSHPWARSEGPVRLMPLTAPWHAAGFVWELAGAKVISYAPNMAASRHAQREGFDDAMLLTVDDVILEGPTFSVGWVVDDVVETPSLDLGILDSITRRVVLELASGMGIEVRETRSMRSRLRDATEVFAFSTIREVQPVAAVGDLEFASGPVCGALHEAMKELIGA